MRGVRALASGKKTSRDVESIDRDRDRGRDCGDARRLPRRETPMMGRDVIASAIIEMDAPESLDMTGHDPSF